jgi:hypothetical protein
MIPMVPLRVLSKRQRPTEPLEDPRDLLKEEVHASTMKNVSWAI